MNYTDCQEGRSCGPVDTSQSVTWCVNLTNAKQICVNPPYMCPQINYQWQLPDDSCLMTAAWWQNPSATQARCTVFLKCWLSIVPYQFDTDGRNKIAVKWCNKCSNMCTWKVRYNHKLCWGPVMHDIMLTFHKLLVPCHLAYCTQLGLKMYTFVVVTTYINLEGGKIFSKLNHQHFFQTN